MVKLWLLGLLTLIFFVACSSGERKLFLDGGTPLAVGKCGTQSFLNRYASYACSSLELENSNDYIRSETPIHNIKGVVVSSNQRLLVIDEKVFGAKLNQKDQQIVCKRRLKVILNPGTGLSPAYQVGWLTYQPQCLRFYNVKPTSNQRPLGRILSRGFGE